LTAGSVLSYVLVVVLFLKFMMQSMCGPCLWHFGHYGSMEVY